MKRILLLIVFMVSMSALKAEHPTIPIEDWTEVKCEIAKKNLGIKNRSLSIPPRVFQTHNEEIAMLAFEGDCEAQILIEDMNGNIVKQDYKNTTVGQPCYFYIGNLKAGEYQVRIETNSFVLTGRIVKE